MSTAPRQAAAPAREPKEMFEQFTAKAIDGLALWADANQKVLRQLVDLSTATAAETLKVQAEFQASAIQAFKTGRQFVLEQQKGAADLAQDPAQLYQKTVTEGIDGAQRAFKLLETSAETMTRSAERLQHSAEQASQGIQSTFAHLAAQLKALYSFSEQ